MSSYSAPPYFLLFTPPSASRPSAGAWSMSESDSSMAGSPSPSLFSPISSSDKSTQAPTEGIIDALTSAGAKPSKSDSLLVSLKSALRTAAAAAAAREPKRSHTRTSRCQVLAHPPADGRGSWTEMALHFATGRRSLRSCPPIWKIKAAASAATLWRWSNL